MGKKTIWHPVRIHFGDAFVEDAIACSHRGNQIYATCYQFGITLSAEQYKESGFTVWWEKTGINDNHRRWVPFGETLREWDS